MKNKTEELKMLIKVALEDCENNYLTKSQINTVLDEIDTYTEQIKKEAVEDFGKFVLKRCNEGILTGSVHSLIDAEIIEYLEKGQNEQNNN